MLPQSGCGIDVGDAGGVSSGTLLCIHQATQCSMCRLGSSKHAQSGASTKWMQNAKEAVAGSMAMPTRQKVRGNPHASPLGGLKQKTATRPKIRFRLKHKGK